MGFKEDIVVLAYTGQTEYSFTLQTGGLTMRHVGLIGIAYFTKIQGPTRTTIHEFGHLFEAPDHYGEYGLPSTEKIRILHNDDRFDPNCIYGENKGKPEVADNITICEGCRAIIIDNISEYVH